MTKRRASMSVDQLGFTFDPPMPARRDADLAGMERVVAAAVAIALKGDARSRFEIAGAVSALLDDEVSKTMLDAYASEARDSHNISAARLLALVAATERFDVLDTLLRRIGAAVLVGDDLLTARLGHLKAQEKALRTEIRKLEGVAVPIEREKRS